jgi:phosphatidylglycerophosphate synthase
MKSGALLTLPNTVSLSRLVLAAAFIVADEPWQRVLLIAAAGATDFLDGWIARRQRIESSTGALLDPVADRAFVLAAVSVYLFESLISTTEYFVILARDFATALGFLVAKAVPQLRPAVFEARLLGKSVTVLQLVFLVVVLLLPVLSDAFVLAIGVLSAASIVDYTLALWRARAR